MSATLFAGSLLVGLAAGGLAGWRLGQRQSSPPPQTASSPENPSPPSRESAHQDNTLAYQRALALAQYQAGFLANTSHELRSPLNQVISLHQLIQADLCESPEEERLFLSQAQEATTRALQNLDLLTAISKLELGRTVPDLQPVQMTLLLTRFQRLIELQAANRNCRLKIALPSEDLYGLSDPHWLQQAMVLLVEGAIAAESHQMFISIQAEDAGPIAILLAHDSPLDAWKIAPTSIDTTTAALPDPAVLKNEPLATLTPYFRQQLATRILEKIQGQLSLSAESLNAADIELLDGSHSIFKLLIPALEEDG